MAIQEPIGERGGFNLYAFVGNDGISFWDMWGLEPGLNDMFAIEDNGFIT